MGELTAIERLEYELNRIDAEREKLQEELDGMRAFATWGWARVTNIEPESDPLPVPRLEIVAHNTSGDWYVTEWVYALVYKHLLGQHVRVPMGHTRQTGGRGIRDVGDMPFRDGAHIKNEARQLNLPAFAVIDGKATRIDV